jgi:hypothetical protein
MKNRAKLRTMACASLDAPIRPGEFDDSLHSDQCIRNLWAAVLQQAIDDATWTEKAPNAKKIREAKSKGPDAVARYWANRVADVEASEKARREARNYLNIRKREDFGFVCDAAGMDRAAVANHIGHIKAQEWPAKLGDGWLTPEYLDAI